MRVLPFTLREGETAVFKLRTTGCLYRVIVPDAKLEHDPTPMLVLRNMDTGEALVLSHAAFNDGRFELVYPAQGDASSTRSRG